jgi:branched-chain amino acid transport system ATP-binding protein
MSVDSVTNATAGTGPAEVSSSAPALSVRNVVAGYERTTVLRDVSIEVARGTTVALVGPNGAGKTTLIKVIAGLMPVTSGTIEMMGDDVTSWAPETRAREHLCTVPEGRGIYRSLTVRENLVLQSPRGTEEASIARATATFPVLGERIKQQAGTLSGGEQQMLSLASAYVRNPQLVVIDEASLGLAPLVVDVVFEFVEKLRQQGISMLVVDQFVHRVLEIASKVYVLSRGSIEFEGSPATFLEGDLFERYLGGQG